MKRIEYEGKRYGDLEVLERVGATARGAILLRCKCHRCGQECIVEGQRLNQKKDCGCRNRERTADLSGKRFGGIEVLRMEGKTGKGGKAYLCRCSYCGKEKILPSSTIRKNPESCGCQQYTPERIKKASQAGIKKKFENRGGAKRADLAAAKATKAMANSKTGVRGVWWDGYSYRASVQVAGERWTKLGYANIEEAKKDRDKAKEELLKKYGLEGE